MNWTFFIVMEDDPKPIILSHTSEKDTVTGAIVDLCSHYYFGPDPKSKDVVVATGVEITDGKTHMVSAVVSMKTLKTIERHDTWL